MGQAIHLRVRRGDWAGVACKRWPERVTSSPSVAKVTCKACLAVAAQDRLAA